MLVLSLLSQLKKGHVLDLCGDQWELLELLLLVLRDLGEATCELNGKKYVTLSMVLPLMHFLYHEMAPRMVYRPAVRTLKANIRQELKTRSGRENLTLS